MKYAGVEMPPEMEQAVLGYRDQARRYALKMVRARKLYRLGDDAIAEAMLGLAEAAIRYRPESGATFGTYAHYWVRKRVHHFLYVNHQAVCPPSMFRTQTVAIKLTRLRPKLAHKLGRWPDAKDFAKELGVTEDCVQTAMYSIASKDRAAAHCDENEISYRVVADRVAPTPEDLVGHVELMEAIEAAMETLTPREADVIRRRHLGDERETLRDIGESHGISRQRVEQIEKDALAKLRRALRSLKDAA